jgi:hypothetical protein
MAHIVGNRLKEFGKDITNTGRERDFGSSGMGMWH